MAGGWDVFVAHSSADIEAARSLFDALTGLGVRACLDDDVLAPGDDWHQLLPGYLDKSSLVVLLVSSSTQASHYQRSELVATIETARRTPGKRLVPVRLQPNARLPYGTEQLQAIDMFDVDGVSAAARRIQQLVTTPTSNDLPREPVFSHRIPMVPRHFTGRDDLLDRLRASLRGSRVTAITQAIHGLGGVGKTSVAAALCEQCRNEFDIVWWVRAEDPALLVADLAELATTLGVGVYDDPSESALLVRRALEGSDRRWLIVFDNVVDQRRLEDVLPRRGSGSVITTSRSGWFPLADEVVPVDVFPSEVAAAFLRRRVHVENPGAADEDLGPVLERLEGLPLALEQAGAWVAQVPTRRFSQFVRLFDDASRDPFPEITRPVGYERTASTVWRVSLDAAEAIAPLAGQVMGVLAFLAPDQIPCRWLRGISRSDFFGRAVPADIGEALEALHLYSLVTLMADDTLRVHRVVQAASRRGASSEAVGAAVGMLLRALPRDPYARSAWPVMATLAPHAMAVARNDDRTLGPFAADISEVLSGVSAFQTLTGDVRRGMWTAARANGLALQALDPSDPVVLHSWIELDAARQTARLPSRPSHEQRATMTACEQVFGVDHFLTVNCRGNLAYACQLEGRIDEAVALFEQVLHDRQQTLGADHALTLIAQTNLAQSVLQSGDVDAALEQLQAALHDSERLLGTDHFSTLLARQNLAVAFRSKGLLDEAVAKLGHLLADMERILGADHSRTLEAKRELDRTMAMRAP